jgi:transcription initiation factor TFIID subunit 5
MTCLEVSEDATIACGGFSDSFIKVWSLTPENLKAYVPNPSANGISSHEFFVYLY